MRIGLNLIFLVPGETGGMEVVARELIPALLDAAPAGIVSPRVVSPDIPSLQSLLNQTLVSY